MNYNIKTSLVLGFLALLSACSLAPDADPIGEQERIFETFYNDVRLTYPFFPIDGVDWDASYKKYRPQVVASSADSTLFRIMSQMMTPLMDGHASLQSPSGQVWSNPKKSIYNPGFNLPLVLTGNRYLNRRDTSGIRRNNVFGGQLADAPGVLYFYIKSFLTRGSARFIDSSIRAFGVANCKGVVIDVRNNGGGLVVECEQVAGLFATQRTLFGYQKLKNGPSIDSYSANEPQYFDPYLSLGFSKAVVLLSNRYSASASERLRFCLQALPNTYAIGDTSYGATSPVIDRLLAGKWKYVLVGSVNTNKEGILYERKGVPPDLRAISTAGQIRRGVDVALDAAMDRLR